MLTWINFRIWIQKLLNQSSPLQDRAKTISLWLSSLSEWNVVFLKYCVLWNVSVVGFKKICLNVVWNDSPLIFTSVREVVSSPLSVCLLIDLGVCMCQQDWGKSSEQISMKLDGRMGTCTKKKLDPVTNMDKDTDPGNLYSFFKIARYGFFLLFLDIFTDVSGNNAWILSIKIRESGILWVIYICNLVWPDWI